MRANRLGKRGDEELALVSPSESDGSLSPRERDRRVPDVDERAARSSTFWVLAAVLVLLVFAAGFAWSSSDAAATADEASAAAILAKAGRRALGGGLSGAVAGVVQVALLMWLRTAMNYQYRHGTRMCETLRVLHAEGGVARFYRGVGFALLQTPLARFGDTAANSGVLALLAATHPGLAVGVRTAVASTAATGWRLAITPLDMLKTTLQVHGDGAYALLVAKARAEGACVLWAGAIANGVANFVGNYPWWLTFNALNEALPTPAGGVLLPRLLRSACLGFASACVSDVVSNSVRVVKTIRQTSDSATSYAAAVRQVVAADGVAGLLGRGLATRLLANSLQATVFTVIWKAIECGTSTDLRHC